MFGYVRTVSSVPDVAVADVQKNTDYILNKINEAAENNADILVFPELCITGYTCGDLFFQSTLKDSVIKSINDISNVSEDKNLITVFGAPIVIKDSIYNCGVVIGEGKVLGIIPKTFLPDYNEFYEKRWFASASELPVDTVLSSDIGLNGMYEIPVGNDIVFNMNGVKFGVEICEDLWAPVSPGQFLAIGGAEILINLSAGNELINKRSFRREMIKQQSSRLICGYVYVSAGDTESVSDMVFAGHCITALNGKIICENKNFIDSDYTMIADIDTERIKNDRAKLRTFKDTESLYGYSHSVRTVDVLYGKEFLSDGSYFEISPNPFIPKDEKKRRERCYDVFSMQATALKRRLDITGGKAVVGVSGGLDSTLALLVSAEAMKIAGRPSKNVIGITMPCFGTTDRTYNNAVKLMETLNVDIKTVPIKDAVIQHFKDIGQDINNHNVTYENAQARERTHVLMDIANMNSGIVVGTGDLSELALGWCTYNGDHMSMYGVNCGVPKTLLKWVIESLIANNVFPDCNEVLKDILDTPISPELLPPDEKGEIKQKTEDSVGPYALNDFFIFYAVRYGFSPSKIYYLAKNAFKGEYENEIILKWLKVFYKRFFTQQFKRNCVPDGVKIGSVSLSPRGDWRMPSDASMKIWLDEVEKITD